MDNLPNPVKPVILVKEVPQATLSYDVRTGLVSMDTVKVSDLNLNDFKRIHAFWRRVLAVKTGPRQ